MHLSSSSAFVLFHQYQMAAVPLEDQAFVHLPCLQSQMIGPTARSAAPGLLNHYGLSQQLKYQKPCFVEHPPPELPLPHQTACGNWACHGAYRHHPSLANHRESMNKHEGIQSQPLFAAHQQYLSLHRKTVSQAAASS